MLNTIELSDAEVRDYYKAVEADLYTARQKRDELQSSLTAVGRRITVLDNMRNALKKLVCLDCGGHGEVRNFIAQDESRIEKCERCKGNGMARRT